MMIQNIKKVDGAKYEPTGHLFTDARNGLKLEFSETSCMQIFDGLVDSLTSHCTLWGKNGPKRLKTENREYGQF